MFCLNGLVQIALWCFNLNDQVRVLTHFSNTEFLCVWEVLFISNIWIIAVKHQPVFAYLFLHFASKSYCMATRDCSFRPWLSRAELPPRAWTVLGYRPGTTVLLYTVLFVVVRFWSWHADSCPKHNPVHFGPFYTCVCVCVYRQLNPLQGP